MNLSKIYIPRILDSVSNKTITDTFQAMRIGSVYYIDKHRKVNERNKVYHFAFINIELFDTPEAKRFMNTIARNGSFKLIYDAANFLYWEVKPYVDREKRAPSVSEATAEAITEAITEASPTFTKQDLDDMEKEFDDLSREIHTTILDAQSYSMWKPTPIYCHFM
jgi:predicted nucleotide-binding protein (sugar kinase/HSP70/actin superfamily)